MDSSFFSAPVKVPGLSGFDKSFQNLYTAPCGTLVPALCDELVAGSLVDLDLAISASLPPLASDTFMRCSLKVEAFFVPLRLLFGGFEHFFVSDTFETVGLDSNDNIAYFDTKVEALPSFSFTPGPLNADAVLAFNSAFGAGSLVDYLGIKTRFDARDVIPRDDEGNLFSIMPLLAYHKVWSDWYRSSLIQRDCFAPLNHDTLWEDSQPVAALPFVSVGSNINYYLDGTNCPLADGVDISSLRQRNFGFDYFTCATPSPQNGDAARVTLDASNLSDGFTISQLRSMNSLQQWRERNNITGDRYVDRLYGQYGCRPSDGIAQRTICLGSADFEVYSKGIYENANGDGSANQNPFAGSVGARFGSASAAGKTTLCRKFKAAEPGYLMVLTSLVPRVTYAMGLDPKFSRYVVPGSIGQMANPILQAIGPEPIYVRELTANVFEGNDIFGYTDRYGSFKNKFDELHGLLRDGESLQSFALQRYLNASSDPRIDSEFLEIPRDYMDGVTAVSGSISEYGVWVDSYFNYRVSMPLARYSLPTLQDPAYEHGKTLVVRRGGFRF